MMMIDNTKNALFALIRAGLWNSGNLDLLIDESTDWQKVYQLASEQNVIGFVLAGLEYSKVRPTQELLLQWIGEVQMIEQQNKSMNQFIEKLVENMRKADIYTLLVKGQGLAQCYEKPLWRSCGDVDLFLSNDNYNKAKEFLLSLSKDNKPERQYSKELALYIESWLVELHGTLRTGLSTKIDTIIDKVQREVFYGGNVRYWLCGKCQVFLPGVNDDIFFVFTHFIKHYYKEEGANLRQICDWCRLLWTYREDVDTDLLKKRLRKAGLMIEWSAFAALAVDYLGMPSEAMPLYHKSKRWSRKADRIVSSVLNGMPSNRFHAIISMMKIFPINTIRLLPGILWDVNMLKVRERLGWSS